MIPAPPSPDRPTLVYLGGSGRSGSTLVERLLGAVGGVTTLGEVVHLPTRGLLGGEDCACGEPFTRCPFWAAVGKRGFGGWDRVDARAWQALQQRVDRNRHLPWLAVPAGARFRRDLTDHIDHLERLYLGAAAETGSGVLVDSSKHASTAFLLRHLRAVDVRFVHLVRDSRGVAYSWTKEVARPETATNIEMSRYSPAHSAAWWDAFNLMLSGLTVAGSPPLRLRYEDLLADPSRALRAILAPTGLALVPGWDDFLGPDGARLGASHSVAGNPMRFTRGTIPLRRDDAWRTHLAPLDRRVVTALTGPLLLAYGYTGPPATDGHLMDSPTRPPTPARREGVAPSVSVVIATRDRPQLLRRAVASVLDQHYPGDIEVLAVFDQSEPDEDLGTGATDVTAPSGARRQIRILRNGRAPGLAGARNTGITAAAGALVGFCDDDDLWLPGKLTAQVALLKAEPDLELVTTGVLVEARGRVSVRVLDRDRITHDELLRSRVSEAHPSTYLARRTALVDGIGLIDEGLPGSYAEDYDLLLRAARRHDVGAVMLPLAKVFWHRSSFFAERWQTIVDALDHLMAAHPELATVPAGLARIEGQQAFALASMGDRRGAVATARRALGHDRRQPRAWLALAVASGVVRSELVLRALQAGGRGI